MRLAFLRDLPWFTPERAIAWCRVLFAIQLLAAVVFVATSHGGIDLRGAPLGTDFTSFWTASKLALEGAPATVYDQSVLAAAERPLRRPDDAGYAAFFYPPIFLLFCLPLALLPYFVALSAWLAAGLYAYWQVIRGFVPAPGADLAILTYPAVFMTIGHGQNGFLITALFAGGLLALERHPVAAGLCFGCLACKPHLAIIVPVLLLVRRSWLTLLVSAATALMLAGIALLVFGVATWHAFLAAGPVARLALEQNLVGAAKMQSVFAALRLLHVGVGAAYAAQIVLALASCVALVALAQQRVAVRGLGVFAVSATLLTTPFLLDYDLTLMAIPLAWTLQQARQTAFLPWEKPILLAAFALPLVVVPLANAVVVPLGPPVLTAVAAIVYRRALATAAFHPI